MNLADAILSSHHADLSMPGSTMASGVDNTRPSRDTLPFIGLSGPAMPEAG